MNLKLINNKTMGTLTNFLAVPAFLLTAHLASAQQSKQQVNVKIMKIVDGDTSVVEKTIDETDLAGLEKEYTSKDGKNIQVKVSINKEGEQAEDIMKNFSFNFSFDSLRNSFPDVKAFIWDDSLFKIDEPIRFIWGDSLMGMDKSIREMMEELKEKIKMPDSIQAIIEKALDKAGDGGQGYFYYYDDEREEVQDHDDAKEKKKVIVARCVKIIDTDKENSGTVEKRKASERKKTASDKIDFYPNPSSGTFSLDFEIEKDETAEVTVTDINGKEVYRDKVRGKGKHHRQIDLGDKSKGIYLLKIRQGENISTRKLIIE